MLQNFHILKINKIVIKCLHLIIKLLLSFVSKNTTAKVKLNVRKNLLNLNQNKKKLFQHLLKEKVFFLLVLPELVNVWVLTHLL